MKIPHAVQLLGAAVISSLVVLSCEHEYMRLAGGEWLPETGFTPVSIAEDAYSHACGLPYSIYANGRARFSPSGRLHEQTVISFTGGADVRVRIDQVSNKYYAGEKWIPRPDMTVQRFVTVTKKLLDGCGSAKKAECVVEVKSRFRHVYLSVEKRTFPQNGIVSLIAQ